MVLECSELLQFILFGFETSLPTKLIHGLVPSRRDQPGARVRRRPLLRPVLQGHCEGFLQCLFRQVEVTQKADQRGENPPRLVPVKAIDIHERIRNG